MEKAIELIQTCKIGNFFSSGYGFPEKITGEGTDIILREKQDEFRQVIIMTPRVATTLRPIATQAAANGCDTAVQ